MFIVVQSLSESVRASKYDNILLAIRHRFGKPMDSVFIRTFPGSDRIPEHRAEDGLERRQISPGSPVQKSPHVRHCPLGEVFVDEFPVGGVPPDQ